MVKIIVKCFGVTSEEWEPPIDVEVEAETLDQAYERARAALPDLGYNPALLEHMMISKIGNTPEAYEAITGLKYS